MTEYAKKTKENIKEVRSKFALSLYSAIAKKTPVDTGRARGNWQIGINKDITETIDRYGLAIDEESQKLDSMKGDEKIFISNNLEYIEALEYGHSKKQAPNGMVGLTLAKAEEYYQEALNSVKR